MARNDVLSVGAASAILLANCAWLTAYFNNRLFAWVGILSVIGISSGLAWFSRSKDANYQDIAKNTAAIGAVTYIAASIIGLIFTKWAHGSWSPELINQTEGLLSKLFNIFPANYMKGILHPSIITIIFGSVLMAVWAALGSSFLPITEEQKSSKKGKK